MSDLTETNADLFSLKYIAVPPKRLLSPFILQLCSFGIVGTLNASIDLLTFNMLLWLLPTQNTYLLLLYSICAYGTGAINSYLLNKWWTFRQKEGSGNSNFGRFVIVNAIGIFCNSMIIWCFMEMVPHLVAGTFLYANISKASALLCSALVSYAGMRWWVFTSSTSNKKEQNLKARMRALEAHEEHRLPPSIVVKDNLTKNNSTKEVISEAGERKGVSPRTTYSLSVILPAHNEEAVIATTIKNVLEILNEWVADFEVLVVNDGSRDRTREIVKELMETNEHIRLIDHMVNQGYGAALVSGFTAVKKDLAFFMDADGQFDIQDLAAFFPLIERYDAVLGYRIKRQDTWIRSLNAWGWKMLTRAVFGLHVRDVDCAFKLYRAEFFRTRQLETRGAMINTEILYKWKRAHYTFAQVGVRHLPRRSGRATGAKISVIIRALKELTFYARKWYLEERRLLPGKDS